MRAIRGNPPRRQRTGLGDGPFRKVTAIIRESVLETVEKRLRELRVPGISVTRVKGFGEYKNFFAPNVLDEHARIETFLPGDQADETARAIVEAAHTGSPGDGIVVVLPVELLYRIRNKKRITAEGLGDPDHRGGSRQPGDKE